MRFEERNEKLVTGVQRVSGTACDSIKHSFLSDAFFVLSRVKATAKSEEKSPSAQKASLKRNVW